MSSSRAALALLLLFAPMPVAARTQRFALVLGNNAGTGARPPLRYAENDAGKVARVLSELGDVPAENLILLQGRSVSELESAVAHLKDAIALAHQAPDSRAVLLFYFSGHGDPGAIELGSQPLPYFRLKAMLQSTAAEVKVTIIDACNSGGAVAQKGGKPAAGFAIRLSDELAATGEVLITSSAADESALESAEVGGSLFTHNFVSGLRGAADLSGDKLVTLAEAYHYAYDHTVSATAIAPSGVQHPAFDYRLSGQGELVLASLARKGATLVIPPGDRWIVTDLAMDQVVAELPPGSAREIALLPGSYGVRVVRGDQSLGGRYALALGQTVRVAIKDLEPLTAPALSLKGPPGSAPVRLCVLPFKNLGGDPLQIGEAIEENLYADLGQNAGIKLVERGQIDVDVNLMHFDGKYADPATRAALGKLSGAEVALLGGYQHTGKMLRVTARFVAVESGVVLHAFKADAPDSQALLLEEQVAKKAKESLVSVRESLRP